VTARFENEKGQNKGAVKQSSRQNPSDVHKRPEANLGQKEARLEREKAMLSLNRVMTV
jgi:hypothetical protein